jgi:hypothetical protein
VPGQAPHLCHQAVQPVHPLLRTTWVHQPITNLGHHVWAVEDLALALLLLGCEPRGDGQECRVDVARNLCMRKQAAVDGGEGP